MVVSQLPLPARARILSRSLPSMSENAAGSQTESASAPQQTEIRNLHKGRKSFKFTDLRHKNAFTHPRTTQMLVQQG